MEKVKSNMALEIFVGPGYQFPIEIAILAIKFRV